MIIKGTDVICWSTETWGQGSEFEPMREFDGIDSVTIPPYVMGSQVVTVVGTVSAILEASTEWFGDDDDNPTLIILADSVLVRRS